MSSKSKSPKSKSPKSSPNADPPSSPSDSTPSDSNPDQTTDTPPPSDSNSGQTTDTPPPPDSNSDQTANAPPPDSNSDKKTPDQTTDTPSPSSPPPPPSPSAPPPESSPPPPPSPPQAPPPETSPPPPPPPAPQSSPPPSAPPLPPPPPPESPPPSPPNAPPPSTPDAPPPSHSSPPPEESPPSPVAPPPPPPAVSPSPPPPATETPPPTATPPPPPDAHPPMHSDSPPPLPPPPTSSPIPPTSSPPASTPYPPTPLPLPPSISPTPPLNNASINGNIPIPPLPSDPTEKPTAKSTESGPNITAEAASRNSGGLSSGGAAAVGSVVGLLALTLLVLGVFFAHRRKKRRGRFTLNYALPSLASSQNSDSSFMRSQFSSQLTGSASANNYMYSPDGGLGASRSWFTYQELSSATNGFSKDRLLGEGGFGCVYKGVIGEGREVAVKQLKAGGGQGEREFRAEVEIISRIHHRHLVSLVGYCISEQQRLLVYDYVPNETLHYHLHGEGKLDWANRVKVAAGAARGLAYLHEDCQPRIIHRDIKSTNILLDNNFEAKVADFGLAKLALELDLHTHVSTRVMGTFGYLAPEYASSGKLTEKSDVFSFGVVLLELITGRRPVDASQPLGDESLVEWARPLLTQALETEDFGEELVDHRLEKNFVPSEMFRMIEAAAACVRHLASKRPKMSQVVRALDSMDELADLNNGVKPGQSGIFTSREHSAQIKMFQRMAFGSQDYSSEYMNNSQTSWRS